MRRIASSLTFGLDYSFCQQLSPRGIMLLVEFEPTFLAVSYRNAITPSHDRAGFVQRRLIVQCFEFERFFDRQSKQNATTVFINAISLGELVEWETQYDALSTADNKGGADGMGK